MRSAAMPVSYTRLALRSVRRNVTGLSPCRTIHGSLLGCK